MTTGGKRGQGRTRARMGKACRAPGWATRPTWTADWTAACCCCCCLKRRTRRSAYPRRHSICSIVELVSSVDLHADNAPKVKILLAGCLVRPCMRSDAHYERRQLRLDWKWPYCGIRTNEAALLGFLQRNKNVSTSRQGTMQDAADSVRHRNS